MTMHLYKNRLVALDVETTGLNPDIHEITQIGAVVLQDNFQLDDAIQPFTILIKPINIAAIAPKALIKSHLTLEQLLAHGIDIEIAVRLWHDWLSQVTDERGGKIIPVGFNYTFDRDFFIQFMGREAYEAIFHGTVRDVMQMMIYVHDRLATQEFNPGYSSFSLNKCCEMLQVENLRAHDALHDSIATAACAYKLLRVAFPSA